MSEAIDTAAAGHSDPLDPSNSSLYDSGRIWDVYKELRETDPVHFTPESPFGPYWSITRFDDIKHALMDNHVPKNGSGELGELILVGQFTIEDQVCCFQLIGILGHFSDGISPILKDSLGTVDKCNGAFTRRRILERGIVRHKTKIVVTHLDLSESHGRNGSVLYGESIGFPGTVISNSQSIGRHALLRGKWG